MFSGVKRVLNFFLRSEDEPDQIETSECVGAGDIAYFRKTGFISFINEDYGLIDGNLYFFQRVAHRGNTLAVGDKVTYLSYKDKGKNSPEKILSVAEYADLNTLAKVLRENCLELRSIDRIFLSYASAFITKGTERVVNGKISRKVGKRIFIFPLNIHCDLDKVQSDFLPIEGDWVSIKIELVQDPFSSTQTLRVTKLEPVLVRYGIGAISLLRDNGEGIIENEIVFNDSVVPPDFKPTLGYPIQYAAIESTQGDFRWRALSVQNPAPRGKDKEANRKKNTSSRFKNGIVVKGKFHFGPMSLDDTEEVVIEVKNNGRVSRALSHCASTSAYCSSQVELREPKEPNEVVLEPGQLKRFYFRCKAKFLGVSKEIFEFYFKGFKMDYLFIVNVTLANELKALLPEDTIRLPNPKKNTYLYTNFDYSDAFYGMKAVQRTRFPASSLNKLSSYVIPENLFKIMLGDPEWCRTRKHSHILEAVLKCHPSLKWDLNIDIYRERFHTFLYFEEIEDRIMYRKFDLHNVILRKKENFLVLAIPRIVEEKIILGVGTQVIVTQPWSETNTGKQVGYIHEYRDHEIIISFHESFERSYDGSECDIMFQPSRTTYVRSHAAVDGAAANLGQSWLFPTELVESPPAVVFDDENVDDFEGPPLGPLESLNMNDTEYYIDDEGFVYPTAAKASGTNAEKDNDMGIKWFNKNLNLQQKRAVRNILQGKGRKIPYIIQGPAGTGKTDTIIELVLQLYNLLPDSRIIIATPSNNAADLVCQKVVGTGNFKPGQLVRLLSFGRLLSGNFPPEISPFCTSTQEDMSTLQGRIGLQGRFLSISECLGSERIVIGTCCTLAILHDYGLKPGHFTHLIVDEAGQCTEPETLIPMNFLDGNKGQVILTGDTEQFGPVTVNFLSTHFGFSKSFMERVIENEPYLKNKVKYPNTGGYDPRCITTLTHKYRSVPDILRLSNLMFYDLELIPTLPNNAGKLAKITRKFNEYVGSPHSSSALLFHGMCGESVREDNSFSWYNPHELWQTVCYPKKLYDFNLTSDDAGIITPYQKQVEKLKQMLGSLKIPAPKIGCVEEFQGQERQIIILSTVRSNATQAGTVENALGLLSCPRRLNVTITRAKAFLIVIGNPYTLSADPCWRELIKYRLRNNFYIGCPLDELLKMPSMTDYSVSKLSIVIYSELIHLIPKNINLNGSVAVRARIRVSAVW